MTPPYAGTHTESRFAREIQQESSNNVALHFRASAPSAPTKSIAYVTRPRTKCRRWVRARTKRPERIAALDGAAEPPEPRCAVPECRGISHADATFREALWDRFFTAAPRPRTPSELLYSDRRLRSKSSPA